MYYKIYFSWTFRVLDLVSSVAINNYGEKCQVHLRTFHFPDLGRLTMTALHIHCWIRTTSVYFAILEQLYTSQQIGKSIHRKSNI